MTATTDTPGRPLRAGIHTIPADTYHADPCAVPSLNASVAKILCDQTPLHAWYQHPRLNPDYIREERATFDFGTAAHAMLLQGQDACMPVDAADWRTKAAREQRDEIRKWGRIPLLLEQWERVTGMVDAVRAGLTELQVDPPLLQDGKAEQTLIWTEPGGVVCRGLVDWLRDDRSAFDDLKTTSRSAHPLTWAQRRLWERGIDVQAAFYQRGLRKLTGIDAQPRLLIVESQPPYAVSVIALAPSALAHAHAKIDWAIDTWRRCLDSGEWPGYTPRVAYAELPAWEASRWAEERYLDDAEDEETAA